VPPISNEVLILKNIEERTLEVEFEGHQMGIWSSGINLAQDARGRSSILTIPQKS
jgi:hypothetical protein